MHYITFIDFLFQCYFFMEHIIALSFEHRIGNKIDRVYPPFPDLPHISDWNYGIPFIGIPDKAHDACSSIIQFTLPDPTSDTGFSYGIAAYRSVEASELSKDPSIIRNHVQKSLCVISKVPLFGELEKPLKSELYNNFESLVENLPAIYDSLQAKVQNRKEFSGISYATLFQALGVNVLTVIKALVMQKRVLIFADNSEMVSKMAMAIGSLLPGYMSTNDFPFQFLGKKEHIYCFAPYVPLQFTETLNNKNIKSALMGTCSELFMVQKIVDYDLLVNARTLPATLTGEKRVFEPTLNETKWMQNVLQEMKKNWEKEETSAWLRDQFTIWFNTLITSILNVRHISNGIPSFARIYLDWELPNEFFGDKFILELLQNSDIDKIIKDNNREAFSKIDQSLLVKKATLGRYFKQLKNRIK